MKSKGKKKKNLSVLALRKAAKLTQGELAALIGASKIAVTSWERGVKRLSPQFAHRIHLATGASTASLLRGDGKNLGPFPNRPYTEETFRDWRKRFGGNAPALAARFGEIGADSLKLILQAAATQGAGKAKDRLPAVWVSLIQWMERTVSSFKLLPEIDAELSARSYAEPITMSYGAWRKTGSLGKMMGFKDDRTRGDSEVVTVETRQQPDWLPGADMRPPPGSKPCPPARVKVVRATFKKPGA